MPLSGSRWVSFGVVATGVAAGSLMGVSAAIPSADGTVSTCISTAARTSFTGLLGPIVTLDRKGTVRAINTEAGETCAPNEMPLTLNVEGPQGEPGLPGPPGPQGPQGEPGPAGGGGGETLWAIVEEDGSILRSNGVVIGPFTGRTGVGVYSVQFDRNITDCAPVATPSRIDTPPGPIDPLIPLVTKTSDTQFEVVVFTPQDTLADSQVSLVVACTDAL